MDFKLAVFSLNQWALDFTGNTKRILESIRLASEEGASYRVGPELEVCGYSLEDAFYEEDTVYHSWLCLLNIVKQCADLDMVVDVGMPVHNSALYNCRIIIYKGKILCIRAKTSLAREGIYREFRHFSPWRNDAGVVAYKLPSFVSEQLKQDYAPFGANFILELEHGNKCDTFRIGWEICQELWEVKNVSSDLYQNYGCHLIINSSASYWELRKLNTINDMIKGISLRGGGCYAFSNCVGCDGQRYVFYGRSCIYDKGNLVAMTPTTSGLFKEVQMITYTIHARDIDEYRAQMGIRPDQTIETGRTWNLINPPKDTSQVDGTYNRFYLPAKLGKNVHSGFVNHISINPSLRFEQEINLYTSLWLWDYLRRSKMEGFMVPLSGGLDSSCVAILVFNMCNYLYTNLKDDQVQEYFKLTHKIEPQEIISKLPSAKVICNYILKCCYLSTKYSSENTFNRAHSLSSEIGAKFGSFSLQDIYTKFRHLLAPSSQDDTVSLLDQNLQARLRMTATYYLSGGRRIVLATGNVDEGIMGYLTKYDCSSADINPIGGMCKADLKSYLRFCCEEMYKGKGLARVLDEIILAPPSAELTGAEQNDEDEIGLTYDEISIFGRVRRGIYGCSGPRGAFETLWRNRKRQPFNEKIRCFNKPDCSIAEQAEDLGKLVKLFYQRYSRNRHKLTVLTPALHTETYSPDDNRYDHRHFLYAPWTEQFKCVDTMVNEIKLNGNLTC